MREESIQVQFVDPIEIRMGSPYCVCQVKLSGAWVPELPSRDEDFQNIEAWSDDGNYLALVQWRISEQNEPGFRILTIAIKERRLKKSRRIRGCCHSLSWKDGAFKYDVVAFQNGSFQQKACSLKLNVF